MIYCDTSLLVSALTLEPTTPQVQLWLSDRGSAGICVSPWVGAELSSALSIKLRRADITSEIRADALRQWHEMLAIGFTLVPVPDEAWDLATGFCNRHEMNLRAPDALHIAVASLGGHALATLDRTMADAALTLGVDVEDIAGL